MGSSSSKLDTKEQNKLEVNKAIDKKITENIINHQIKVPINKVFNDQNQIIYIANNNYNKNAVPPIRITNYIHKKQLTRDIIDIKQLKSQLKRSIKLDLKNINFIENRRKVISKISLVAQKRNKLKIKQNMTKFKQINAKLHRDKYRQFKNNNNQWKNYNNKIKIMKDKNSEFIEIKKKCENAYNNHCLFINRRINKLKLHNFIVKQRSNRNKNIINIKCGE